MANLRDFSAKKLRSLVADLGDGDEIGFKYDSSLYTEAFITQVEEMGGTEDTATLASNLKVVNFMIRTLVRIWDLRDAPATDGGQLIALTQEAISALPIEITGKVVDAIFTDQNPGNA